MRANDPNIEMIQIVSKALGHLNRELVFVGGCAVGLLITEPARPPARATIDVDLVSEVSTLMEYYRLAERLKAAGFKEDIDGPTCRWKYGQLIVDVMPREVAALGFSNRWYGEAIRSATDIELPNKNVIRMVSAPLMLATKIEAFQGRGNGDYTASRDIEDIVAVVDGRSELLEEVGRAPIEVQDYLREEFDELLANSYFFESIAGHLNPDAASQARRSFVVEKLRTIAGL